MQQLIWNLTITLIGALAAVFAFVVARSTNPADYAPIDIRAQRLRSFYFWALGAAILVASIVTLAQLPYPGQRPWPADRQVIHATAYQWYWELDADRVDVGRTVEFQVTSSDVNHGFGLYDGALRLLAQTQAMPGYINTLRFTFTEPGSDKVLCMEYCGLAHPEMIAEIDVLEP